MSIRCILPCRRKFDNDEDKAKATDFLTEQIERYPNLLEGEVVRSFFMQEIVPQCIADDETKLMKVYSEVENKWAFFNCVLRHTSNEKLQHVAKKIGKINFYPGTDIKFNQTSEILKKYGLD